MPVRLPLAGPLTAPTFEAQQSATEKRRVVSRSGLGDFWQDALQDQFRPSPAEPNIGCPRGGEGGRERNRVVVGGCVLDEGRLWIGSGVVPIWLCVGQIDSGCIWSARRIIQGFLPRCFHIGYRNGFGHI